MTKRASDAMAERRKGRITQNVVNVRGGEEKKRGREFFFCFRRVPTDEKKKRRMLVRICMAKINLSSEGKKKKKRLECTV